MPIEKREKKEKRAGKPENLKYREWLSSKVKKTVDEEALLEEEPRADSAASSQEPAQDTSETKPEEAAPFPPAARPRRPLAQDFLQILWRSWAGGRAVNELYDPLGYAGLQSEKGFADCVPELEEFIDQQQLFAETLMQRLGDPNAPPCDAQVHVKLSKDCLRAWVMIFPPTGGGREITEEDMSEALKAAHIVFGLFEEELRDAVANRHYLCLIPAAKGIPPVSGKDGELIECISRQSSVQRNDSQDDLQEFENKISFQNVSVGTVLYRATLPTEGADGIDVRGNKLRGRMGKAPEFPRIPNTALSEDRTELVSTVDGVISFLNDQFVVDRLMVVNGNVDTASGDIDFDGDIQIEGDITEGRTVTASGSVDIHGMVEIGHVFAGRDILIAKGMNGNQEGSLHAGRNITSKYLENCTARAGGMIQTNSIICSDVTSDDCILVEGGKGFIIGGSCTALRSITAEGIGAKSQRPTLIVLGSTPHLLEQCMELEAKLEAAKAELNEVEKNLKYLNSLSPSQITPERRKLYPQLRLKKPLLMLRIQKLELKHDELEAEIQNIGACRIVCNSLYPATKIMIGAAAVTVEQEHHSCMVYYSREQGAIIISP